MWDRLWGMVLCPRSRVPEVGEGMPIYEFKCSACGAVAEVLQRMDAPAPICRECSQEATGGTRMVKQVSRSSFVLKGGGWASDGYK